MLIVLQTISILVRTAQHDAIVSDLLRSGEWEDSTLDRQEPGLPTLEEPSPGDTVLRSLDAPAEPTYLRLYTEELYCLPVDVPTFRIPAIEASVPVLYEEEYHPDPHLRYGPPTPSHPGSDRVELPDPKSPFFVPTIQAHLNACLDQLRKYEDDGSKGELVADASFNIRNYIRYLFLERPHQREKIMSKVCDRNKKLMEDRLNRYKRKLCVGIDRQSKTLYNVIPWELPIPEALTGCRDDMA